MKEINDSLFQEQVMESDIPVVVDFWAPWCGPCKMIAPVMEELDEHYGGKIKFCKVNVDENPITAEKYRVVSIPTIIVFKGGSAVETMVGFKPKAAFEEILNKYL